MNDHLNSPLCLNVYQFVNNGFPYIDHPFYILHSIFSVIQDTLDVAGKTNLSLLRYFAETLSHRTRTLSMTLTPD